MNYEDPTAFDLYRLNITDGEIEFVLPFVEGAVLDGEGVIRMVVSTDGFATNIFHRLTDEDEFELVGSFGFEDAFVVLGFDANDENIFAATNVGMETLALVSANPATLEISEIIFQHEDYDINGAFPNSAGGISRINYWSDYLEWVFFDAEFEEFYNNIAARFEPNSVILVGSLAQDFSAAIISVFSDVNRGQMFLYNGNDDSLELLSDTNTTNPENMANMIPVSYTARDGLTIRGYLTLPVNMSPRNLPMVVIPHGGPWLRDTWGFNDEVQFLANRGYAVFQPNFRGSSGFGRSFLEAGNRQWGLAMQDDITDGVQWLIDIGIANPRRIAIYGASYGGYAALAGVTFTPDLFAAGVSYVGVSSLFTFLENIPAHWESQLAMLHERVGHPVYDADLFYAVSPLFHADQIRVPMLIAHGANDVRVALVESQQIVEALEANGISVEFIVNWDEGHGFVNLDNVIDLYTTLERFLAEHIGGRFIPLVVEEEEVEEIVEEVVEEAEEIEEIEEVEEETNEESEEDNNEDEDEEQDLAA